MYPDRDVVPGAVVDEPQSSSPLELEQMEFALVSKESPKGATLLLDRDTRFPPLIPVDKVKSLAVAPKSSCFDFAVFGVALLSPRVGAGATVANGLLLLVAEDVLKSSSAGALLHRERLSLKPPFGESLDLCPLSLN